MTPTQKQLTAFAGIALVAVVTGHSGVLSPWHLMFFVVTVNDAPAEVRNGTHDV